MSKYEYAIVMRADPGKIRRGPWDEDEILPWEHAAEITEYVFAERWCELFIAESIADGFKPGAFYTIRREVGEWKR